MNWLYHQIFAEILKPVREAQQDGGRFFVHQLGMLCLWVLLFMGVLLLIASSVLERNCISFEQNMKKLFPWTNKKHNLKMN